MWRRASSGGQAGRVVGKSLSSWPLMLCWLPVGRFGTSCFSYERLFCGFRHGADDGTGTPALGVLAACSQGGAGPRWARMGIPVQSLGLHGPLASPGAVSFGEQSKWEGLAVAAGAGPF